MTATPTRVTAEHYRQMAAPKPRNKYGAKRTVAHDGSQVFASKAEARRYAELKLLADKGEIFELVCQPVYPLVVDGIKVGKYIADYKYTDKSGRIVIEDVKGRKATQTPLSRFKIKLFEALYKGLKVEIVT